jgi:hypothetical protein
MRKTEVRRELPHDGNDWSDEASARTIVQVSLLEPLTARFDIFPWTTFRIAK